MDVDSVCTLAEPGVPPKVLPETFNLGSPYTMTHILEIAVIGEAILKAPEQKLVEIDIYK